GSLNAVAKQPLVRIGTRASKLALTQSGMMQRAIAVALGFDEAQADEVAPLVQITTSGDRIQDRRLLEEGGKGLFTKEIEEALLDGRIDVAIHSLKDVPSVVPKGLVIAALPEREDPRDAYLSLKYDRFEDLPHRHRRPRPSGRRRPRPGRRGPDPGRQAAVPPRSLGAHRRRGPGAGPGPRAWPVDPGRGRRAAFPRPLIVGPRQVAAGWSFG